MDSAALREALIALAGECGVGVRRIRAASEATPGLTSGPMRLRGQPWVALVEGEPPAAHVAALADALLGFAGSALDSRYLPPAVRACLDQAAVRKTR